MRIYRPWLVATATAGGLVLALQPAVAAPSVPPTPAPAVAKTGLSANSIAQIDALAQAKSRRSATQQKVDSTLLAAAQLRRGARLPAGARSAPVPTDSAGRTTVDIRGKIDSRLLDQIGAVGGKLVTSSAKRGIARADVPLTSVERLATSSRITRISSVAAGAITSSGRSTASFGTAGFAGSTAAGDLAAAVQERRTRKPVAAQQGSVGSEGDVAMGVDTARSALRVSGVGVTVGVLSDGVDSLAGSIASGDLPADTQVLPGQNGQGDEGTAMLEIVHDLAPKSKLIFATAFDGADSFAANIRALRAAGADVIVDDVIYFAESPFQDGPIAQAVRDVTADGGLYFSSAGNEGNVTDGTSGNYEGDFRSSGVRIGKYAGVAHDFAPGSAVQTVNPLSPGSAGVPALLQWADPLGQAADDYDLYVLDADGNVVGFSNDTQDGNDDPFEGIYLPDSFGTSLRLAVVKYAGANRYFQITAFRGRFAADGPLRAYTSRGVTRGHSAVPAAFSVAAVPAGTAFPRPLEGGDPANPAGPYPGTYTAAQQTERFTSDGPRRVFFNAAGRAITPGNFTSTGGVLRQKPDLAASDGVRTSAPGFDPFFGTSAAAPHAAAVAALMVSGHPGITPAAVRRALTGTALDIEARGFDRDTGFGIVQAGAALRRAGVSAQPFAEPGAPVLTSTADGDAYLEPGEVGLLAVPVTNNGDATARNVRVTLTSTTPGVTFTPATLSLGDLAAGATQTPSLQITAPAGLGVGTTVAVEATVAFTGAYSPQRATGSLAIGQPSATVVDAAYTGEPVAIPDADPAGATVSIPVTGVGVLNELTVSIDGETCTTEEGATTVGINHPFVGDLQGSLTAPDGTQVQLFASAGGAGDNLCKVVFTDAATRAWSSAVPEEAPFTGEWLPQVPLSQLAGRQADGIWQFTVVDQNTADEGTLRSVSLHLRGYAAS